MKKKWVRYTVGAIGACIAAWIILLAIGFFYVKSQKEKLIATIEEDISQKLAAKLSFDDLSVDFTGHKNWNILKKKPGNKNNTDLRKITLKNIGVVFEDIGKLKYFNV